MASVQGWGRQAWGDGAWSAYGPIPVTGIGLTASTNNVTVTTDQVISVTGIGLTSNTKTPTATGVAEAVISAGVVATWQPIGTYIVQSDYIFPITGTSATSAVGTTSQTVDIRVGWNRSTNLNTGAAIGWGDEAWGAISNSPSATGNGLTSGVGSITATTDQILSPTANGLTTSIGTYSITGDAGITIVAASEPELDASTGSVSIAISPTVEPTGQLATSSVGSVLTSIFVTGVSATVSEGDAIQETSYMAPSEEATTAVGSVNITIDVSFTLTGVSATSSTGTLGGIFWSEVDDSNSSISWAEVHKAA
jgi:hypothetical protein